MRAQVTFCARYCRWWLRLLLLKLRYPMLVFRSRYFGLLFRLSERHKLLFHCNRTVTKVYQMMLYLSYRPSLTDEQIYSMYNVREVAHSPPRKADWRISIKDYHRNKTLIRVLFSTRERCFDRLNITNGKNARGRGYWPLF